MSIKNSLSGQSIRDRHHTCPPHTRKSMSFSEALEFGPFFKLPVKVHFIVYVLKNIDRVQAFWYKLNSCQHFLASRTFLGHVTSMRLRPLNGPLVRWSKCRKKSIRDRHHTWPPHTPKSITQAKVNHTRQSRLSAARNFFGTY